MRERLEALAGDEAAAPRARQEPTVAGLPPEPWFRPPG
jgi:hypothetical protein